VTERCQDGWYKGTSNRTQKCGVFPGNYVAYMKGSSSDPKVANGGESSRKLHLKPRHPSPSKVKFVRRRKSRENRRADRA
jgi:hypothetical protein